MNLEQLAADLKAGNITLAEWEAGMRQYLREQYEAAMILAKGGRDFITQSDWGFVGAQAKKQYQYLDGFAAEITANPTAWLTGGRLQARVGLYAQVGYTALEEDIAREKLKAGFTEERRVLGPVRTEHCEDTANRPGCVELAAKGWQPIGTLPPIGEASCWSNCKCSFEYRKPDPENPGQWIYGDANE